MAIAIRQFSLCTCRTDLAPLPFCGVFMPNSRKEAPIILAARGYRRKPSFAMAAVLDKEAVVGFVVHIELDCGICDRMIRIARHCA